MKIAAVPDETGIACLLPLKLVSEEENFWLYFPPYLGSEPLQNASIANRAVAIK